MPVRLMYCLVMQTLEDEINSKQYTKGTKYEI